MSKIWPVGWILHTESHHLAPSATHISKQYAGTMWGIPDGPACCMKHLLQLASQNNRAATKCSTAPEKLQATPRPCYMQQQLQGQAVQPGSANGSSRIMQPSPGEDRTYFGCLKTCTRMWGWAGPWTSPTPYVWPSRPDGFHTPNLKQQILYYSRRLPIAGHYFSISLYNTEYFRTDPPHLKNTNKNLPDVPVTQNISHLKIQYLVPYLLK